MGKYETIDDEGQQPEQNNTVSTPHPENETEILLANEHGQAARPEQDEYECIYYSGALNDPHIHHRVILPKTFFRNSEFDNNKTKWIDVEMPRRGIEEDEKVCRFCQDDDHKHDMIMPCKCTGSVSWIHRKCLDEWRAVSNNQDSFMQCDLCKQTFIIERKDNLRAAKKKYRWLVTRDLFVAFILLVILYFISLGIVAIIDVASNPFGAETFTPTQRIFVDLGFGLAFFFVFFAFYGMAACLMKMCNCTCLSPHKNPPKKIGIAYYYYLCCFPILPSKDASQERHVGYNEPCCSTFCDGCGGGGLGHSHHSDCDLCFICCYTSAYQPYPPCYCGGCTGCSGGGCGGCSGGGGGDGGLAVCAIVLIVLLVILVVIGIIMFMIIITMFVSLVLTQHLGVLAKQTLTSVYTVKDLSDKAVEQQV